MDDLARINEATGGRALPLAGRIIQAIQEAHVSSDDASLALHYALTAITNYGPRALGKDSQSL